MYTPFLMIRVIINTIIIQFIIITSPKKANRFRETVTFRGPLELLVGHSLVSYPLSRRSLIRRPWCEPATPVIVLRLPLINNKHSYQLSPSQCSLQGVSSVHYKVSQVFTTRCLRMICLNKVYFLIHDLNTCINAHWTSSCSLQARCPRMISLIKVYFLMHDLTMYVFYFKTLISVIINFLLAIVGINT